MTKVFAMTTLAVMLAMPVAGHAQPVSYKAKEMTVYIGGKDGLILKCKLDPTGAGVGLSPIFLKTQSERDHFRIQLGQTKVARPRCKIELEENEYSAWVQIGEYTQCRFKGHHDFRGIFSSPHGWDVETPWGLNDRLVAEYATEPFEKAARDVEDCKAAAETSKEQLPLEGASSEATSEPGSGKLKPCKDGKERLGDECYALCSQEWLRKKMPDLNRSRHRFLRGGADHEEVFMRAPVDLKDWKKGTHNTKIPGAVRWEVPVKRKPGSRGHEGPERSGIERCLKATAIGFRTLSPETSRILRTKRVKVQKNKTYGVIRFEAKPKQQLKVQGAMGELSKAKGRFVTNLKNCLRGLRNSHWEKRDKISFTVHVNSKKVEVSLPDLSKKKVRGDVIVGEGQCTEWRSGRSGRSGRWTRTTRDECKFARSSEKLKRHPHRSYKKTNVSYKKTYVPWVSREGLVAWLRKADSEQHRMHLAEYDLASKGFWIKRTSAPSPLQGRPSDNARSKIDNSCLMRTQ